MAASLLYVCQWTLKKYCGKHVKTDPATESSHWRKTVFHAVITIFQL